MPMETSHPTVLVIDDHAATLSLLVDLLETEGYRVECAESAAAGLSRLQHGPVDLLLVDLMLPDLSGLEVSRRVRTRSDLADVPIVLYSAATGPGWEQACLAAGANEYIAKPFDIEKLLGLVHIHLAPLPVGR
jgi:CheY-like chemotaxis protein